MLLQRPPKATYTMPMQEGNEVALKPPVSLLGSRERELLLSMGPYRIFRTTYSIAPAVVRKDTTSCAVEHSLQTFRCI